MKKNYTHIVFLIDRSGSMISIKEDMEGGIKTFLEEQRKVSGECTITAAQFDDVYEILHKQKSIHEVKEIQIIPRGWTALVDSMVKLINEVGEDLAKIEESQRPEKVLFITITDGIENASKECTNKQLAELINNQETKYNWQFTYLGANQDAFATAGGIGVQSGKTMTYLGSKAGIDKMFSKLSAASVRFRGASTENASFEYTPEEQKDI